MDQSVADDAEHEFGIRSRGTLSISHGGDIPMLLAYFAPETILPATSALATAAGFLLLFGRQAARPVIGLFRRTFRLDRRPAPGATAIPRPHLPGFRKVTEGSPEGHPAAAPWNRQADS
jgi:hypothetical protein